MKKTLIITGNQGVGKTELSNKIAELFNKERILKLELFDLRTSTINYLKRSSDLIIVDNLSRNDILEILEDFIKPNPDLIFILITNSDFLDKDYESDYFNIVNLK